MSGSPAPAAAQRRPIQVVVSFASAWAAGGHPLVATLEWTLVAALVALFVLKGLVVGWHSLNSDFPNYYLVGKLFRDGYPLDRVYDWVWIQRQKSHAGIDFPVVGYVPLSLFSALIVAPLTRLAPLEAKQVWLVVNLVLLLGTVGLLHSLTTLPFRRIALIVFLTIVPLRTNFQFGQQHLLVLFLLTLAAWADSRDRSFTSGAVVAMAAALKVYPAFFVLYFIRKRLWGALRGFSCAAVGLLALGIALFGWEAVRVYAVQIVPRTLRAECNDPYTVVFNSATALLRRLLVAEPDLNPHPLAHWPTFFAAVQPLIQAAIIVPGLWVLTPGRAERTREGLEWAGFVALLLALSSGSATYHFCVLILPSVIAFDHLVKGGRPRAGLLLVALHATVCLPFYRFVPQAPDGWRIFLGFPRLYAVAGYWIFFLVNLLRSPVEATSSQSVRRAKAIAFGLLFCALVSVGVATNIGHFRHQFDDYPGRLAAGNQSLVNTAPGIAGDAVYFSRMDSDGYVLDRTGTAALTMKAPPGTDIFNPAVESGSDVGWLEVSSRPTSRIARFRLGADTLAVQELPIEVDDAQQPVVSADGRWLGFLRSEKGRGRMYLLERASVAIGAWQKPPREIAGAPGDVLEFAFLPNGRVILSAFRDRRARLFLGDATSDRFEELQISSRPVRFPAVSPDGAWLAYGEEEGGAWHLWVASMSTWERHRITKGDCNATLPAWLGDSKTLIYASDCARGLGHSALCRKRAVR